MRQHYILKNYIYEIHHIQVPYSGALKTVLN